MEILIINGPNLNLTGIRSPEIYGSQNFEAAVIEWVQRFPEHEIRYYQSNHEGELIDQLHQEGFKEGLILLNAGGLTHTSVSLADAVAAIQRPVIEVHLSNPYTREDFRRKSLLSPYCISVIAGFGMEGYALAIEGYLKKKGLK